MCPTSSSPGSNKCVGRNFGHGSVVCECNATYCDSVGSVSLPPRGQYSSYLSSMAGSRLERGQGQVQVNSTGAGEWWSGLLLGCQWCWSGWWRISSVVITHLLRPQVDHCVRPEVPEDQGVWWSHDGLSGHQHPVPVCWSTGPAAATVFFQWRYCIWPLVAAVSYLGNAPEEQGVYVLSRNIPGSLYIKGLHTHAGIKHQFADVEISSNMKKNTLHTISEKWKSPYPLLLWLSCTAGT